MNAQYVETEKSELKQVVQGEDFVTRGMRNAVEEETFTPVKESTVRSEVSVHSKRYDMMSEETSYEIREKLWNSLVYGKRMESIFEGEEAKYFGRLKSIIHELKANNAKRIEESEKKVETNKVLIRSRIPILVAYLALVLVVVAAIVAIVPGTAWETPELGMTTMQRAIINDNVEAYAPNIPTINTIVTEEGPVAVELTPYAENEDLYTNWFDKFCDKLSEFLGG